ncbi:hypothetical protein [Corynebacterium sp.]|uniref:hypothetical protein n=1 Tax=Corynebacterium sp. TaxID=1720 RepID=UPI0028A90C2E|nr:hypothetical protein [Corynebacterium sp.]
MTNKKPPVTDDPPMNLLTQWRQWADRYESVDDPNEAELIIDDLTASIQANIPAPPKSLADELREWAGELPAPDTEPDPWVTFDAIVKHAEAVDAENERLRADAEELQAWNQKITDENATLSRERAEARNELDKLKFETLEGMTARGWMRARKAAEQEVEQLRGESPADSTDIVIGWVRDYRAELQNGYDGSWEPVREDEDGGWSNRAVAEERIKHWQGDFPFAVGARICTRAVTATTTVREEHRDE